MLSTSSPERRIKTVSDRRRRADDDDDDLMPRVPCNDRERRRRAKRGHRPPDEREQTLESSKNRIKIQMGIKRSRGKTRSCNSLELTSLHLFIKALLITVAIVAPHQVLTSAADHQGLAPRRQQQIAKQQPDDRWFRGTLIIVPEDNYGAGVFPSLASDEMSYEQPIDEPLFLRRRRHGPPSQDEFVAPTQDNNQEQDSESRDDDQPTADGGNQFDSEHSAAAASSMAMADDDDDHRASTSSQKLKMTTNATSKQQAAAANNKTEPTCDTLEDVEASRPPRTFGMILAVGYGVIFVLGLIGNVITLYVLWCKGKKRTAQDVLVANLAISDVLLCVFCVPIMPKYLIIDGYWTLGLVFCKVVSFAQSTSVYMSTYSLIYIGWIRYKLIVHPLENKKWVTQKGYALIACALTWTTAITLTVPYTSKVRLAPQECEIMFCDEDWEAKNWRFLFSLFTTVFQFIIPLAAVGFFNRKIYARLDERAGGSHSHPHSQNHNNHVAPNLSARKSIVATTTTGGGGSASLTGKRAGVGIEPEAHTVAGESHLYNYVHHNVRPPPLASREPPQSNDVLALKEFKQREKNRRMQKANNRLIFVVVVFAHSWLPLNLFNMIQDYFEELGHWKYLTTTFLVVHQIACSSVIWNPILYAWMSETYRSELRAALPKFLVAKLSSCLSDGPTGGGAVGQHHHNVGGAHGPASTSICALHPNNNNTTNGHHDHRRSSNLTNNGQHQTKSHMNLNQQPLQMLHTELAKARSIDHISKVRNELQPADCCRDHDHDDDEIHSLGHRSEIILTRNNNNNRNDNEDMTGGGRISPGVVSSD